MYTKTQDLKLFVIYHLPQHPLGIVFYVAILIGLIGGMWTAPEPKET